MGKLKIIAIVYTVVLLVLFVTFSYLITTVRGPYFQNEDVNDSRRYLSDSDFLEDDLSADKVPSEDYSYYEDEDPSVALKSLQKLFSISDKGFQKLIKLSKILRTTEKLQENSTRDFTMPDENYDNTKLEKVTKSTVRNNNEIISNLTQELVKTSALTNDGLQNILNFLINLALKTSKKGENKSVIEPKLIM